MAEGQIIVQSGGDIRAVPIESLSSAGDHCGVNPSTEAAEGDSPPPGDLERPLMVDAESTAFLDDWFGFAFSALEELRLTPGARDVGRTQLWPGHLDPGVEITAGDPGDETGTDETGTDETGNPGMTRPGLTRPGMTRPGMTRPGMTRPGLTRPGLTRPGIRE